MLLQIRFLSSWLHHQVSMHVVHTYVMLCTQRIISTFIEQCMGFIHSFIRRKMSRIFQVGCISSGMNHHLVKRDKKRVFETQWTNIFRIKIIWLNRKKRFYKFYRFSYTSINSIKKLSNIIQKWTFEQVLRFYNKLDLKSSRNAK